MNVLVRWMRSFFSELDQYGGHVIHSILVSAVLGDKFIKQFFTDEFKVFSIESGLNPIYHFLVCLDLPYTITSHYNKIYVLIFNSCNVRLSGNHLFLSWQWVVSLVFSITECSWEIESSIDSTKCNSSTCFGDSTNFLWIFRLMVSTKLLGLSLDTSNCSRITCIGTINKLWCDKNDISSTTSMWFLFILGTVFYLSHLFLNGYNLFLALWTEDQIVHSKESLFQSYLVVTLFVICVRLQLVHKVTLNKFWTLSTYSY